uniref:Uncharacterized protein n=1 Tax=Babesia bovis TaxID=5865 RepID=S6BPX6_BABBO|nr:hypothetical protein [Babesia bovis]
MDEAELRHLEAHSRNLLTGNLRDAAMLSLMLHNFGGNVDSLLNSVKVSTSSPDLDIYFRATAECGMEKPYISLQDILDTPGAVTSAREIYNFFCGACLFNQRGVLMPLESLMERVYNLGFEEFSSLQLLQMAGCIAPFEDDRYRALVVSLCDELSNRNLHDIVFGDLIDGLSKLCRHYQSDILFPKFIEYMGAYSADAMLSPSEMSAVLYILSRNRKGDPLLMDRLSINLRRDIGNYDLLQISRVVVYLSQIGYYNRALVSLLGRMVLTLIDCNSIVDPCVLTNLYTGFSRFLHHKGLFDLFSSILRKEEVFADLALHDAVSIVQSYARVHVIDDRLFRLFDAKLFTQPLNTTLSYKLLVAHGKLRYFNPRLHNLLVNNINLQEVVSDIDREKLKLAAERLGLFFPELVYSGIDSAIPRITWRRMTPIRKNLGHVRRRKWTW